jgi:hypothetical protein
MPELDKKFFQGHGAIQPDILEKLFGNSPTQIDMGVARQLGWDGKLAGSIIIHLSEDGARARRGTFNIMGDMVEQPITIAASKIWEKADKDINISITLPRAENFGFLDGGLTSDYMDHDQVEYVISRGSVPIMPAHYQRIGVQGFSLRTIAHLARGSNGRGGLALKITVLIFPLDADELRQESPAVQSAAWAGIRLLEAECPLFPLAPLNSWGCPIFPILYRQDERVPCTASSQELQHAIASVMRSACNPTSCTSTTALRRFWRTMSEDPEKAEPRSPHIIWPQCERPQTDDGKPFEV